MRSLLLILAVIAICASPLSAVHYEFVLRVDGHPFLFYAEATPYRGTTRLPSEATILTFAQEIVKDSEGDAMSREFFELTSPDSAPVHFMLTVQLALDAEFGILF